MSTTENPTTIAVPLPDDAGVRRRYLALAYDLDSARIARDEAVEADPRVVEARARHAEATAAQEAAYAACRAAQTALNVALTAAEVPLSAEVDRIEAEMTAIDDERGGCDWDEDGLPTRCALTGLPVFGDDETEDLGDGRVILAACLGGAGAGGVA